MAGSTAGHVRSVPIHVAFVRGVVLALALLFEHTVSKYHLGQSAGPGRQKTKQPFIDPEANEHVTVCFNPTTHARLFVRPVALR